MSDLKAIIDQVLRIPLDAENEGRINLDFSFDNFSPNINLVDNINFLFKATNDEVDVVNFINNWVRDKGIQNGIPLQLFDESTSTLLSNGILDLANNNNAFNTERCQYAIEYVQDNNSFFELADGLSLRGVSNNPKIPNNLRYNVSDYNSVRYVLNNVPDIVTSITTSLTLFIIGKEIRNAIKNLKDVITDGATSGLFGAIAFALKLAAAVAYVGFVVAAAVKLLKELSDTLFAKPKKQYTIPVKTLIEKAVNYLGYEFESDLFDGEWAKMSYYAATSIEGKISGNPENNPIPDKTLLQVLNDIGTIFNAKIKVTPDKKVIFRNKFSFIENPINFFLEDLKEKGSFKFNLNELPQSMDIKFQRDPIETNTYLRINALGINLTGGSVSTKGDGLNVSYVVDSIKTENSRLTNKMDVRIPFSRGYRKNFQTTIEKAFNSIYDLVGKLAGIIPGVKNPNKGNKIGDRIGYLLQNFDFTSSDKIIILEDNDKVSTKNFETIHAENIYNLFYEQESPVHNQWKIVEGRDKQPICQLNFIPLLRESNIVKDHTGRTALLETHKMNPQTGLHEISYRTRLLAGDFGHIPSSQFTTKLNDIE